MPVVEQMGTQTPHPRRQVAERNAEAILDAALRLLERGEQASVAAVAAEAGLSRVTLYAHFASREALIDALTHRGIEQVTRAIEAAEPDRGDAPEALARVLGSAWRTLGRYHSVVAINTGRSHSDMHSRHDSALSVLEPLIERGQRDGSFRIDVPVRWHLAMILALIHAASGELDARRVSAEEAERALVGTVLGALVNGRSPQA